MSKIEQGLREALAGQITVRTVLVERCACCGVSGGHVSDCDANLLAMKRPHPLSTPYGHQCPSCGLIMTPRRPEREAIARAAYESAPSGRLWADCDDGHREHFRRMADAIWNLWRRS